MAGQRVLGRIRLSRLTEESTSAARQRELIQQWADMNEHTVVGWAEDLDVSGSIDPFDSPSLGPWFREDKRDEWDILVAWKLDRIGRRAIALNRVFGWMMDHNKTLVCVSDNIDLSTWVGRLVANVIAGVAEGELEAIRERTRAGRKKILESGRWPGGVVPYGLRPVPNPGGGWKLEVDPEPASVIHRIVDEIIAGSAVEAVANRLDEDGIPAPKGGTWLPSTIWKLCGSNHLLGHARYGGKSVRDAEGRPVLNAEPILTWDQWDALQRALEARRRGGSRTRDTSPLLGVAVCYECDKPLFHKIYKRDYGRRLYRYYHCRDKTHNQQVEAEVVETLLEESFLQRIGDLPVLERVFIPSENHEIELEEARRAIEELTPLLATVTSATMRKSLLEQLSALDSRLTELEALPTREAHWEYRETGQTYAEAWKEADTEGRRQILLRSGITLAVILTGKTRNSGGALKFDFRVPEDIEKRLSA
ncbi:serine integrase [Mycobacterium phage Topanga]|nr:serine integrase [Mycobacterium phage Topanga]